MVTKMSSKVELSIIERDEFTIDMVSMMARRLGARLEVYCDTQTAAADIPLHPPRILLLEPRSLDCELSEFVERIEAEERHVAVILVTGMTADELRSKCLPICWRARLQKPFTYNRFRGVIRPLLGSGAAGEDGA